MPPEIVRSPVDICFGTRPEPGGEVAALTECRTVAIAATIALAVIGPIPGTLIRPLQFSLCLRIARPRW